ncbi:hypothetical protein TPHA_0G02910 [Tetrapisispora phaffii CBS 4417]|uniref:non-specific serine/threonine protein kinase n=1 Tax=Tetrapisispora phaffii (strain ATCC 24235 / CBS 4417 / NBRC 1672 / NRRL Y-8282 / UCD 70-5) TaxID=1071381 RepID=G8BW54_TETPH|nr:hypothetical protein TPHA_0G02910 [Tetrapisispora phaffii CBS 4417]CCE64132.1 hypothetical protein TPHA_0G02910 [Tetrapisispora phaffii CBS 4417]
MYSWKLSKLRFNKSKEEKNNKEKENESEKGHDINRTKSPSLFHFHHEKKNNSEESGLEGRSAVESDADRETVITKNPEHHTSNAHDTDFASHLTDNSTSNEETKHQEQFSANNEENKQPSDTSSNIGLMTIKIYSGSDFILPFSLTSNKQILAKLMSSGAPPPGEDSLDIDDITSKLSKLNIVSDNNSPYEELITGDKCTDIVPATIKLPGSETLNPLLYFTIEFDNTVATIEPEYGTIRNPVFNKISSFDVTRKLSSLKIDVFARIPSILLPSTVWQKEASAEDEKVSQLLSKINSNQDIHIDSFELPLSLFINSAANVRLYNHHWVNLKDGFGKLNLSIDYRPSRNKPLSIDDFDLLKVIGKGSFGKVMQVRKKDTKNIYALKAIKKSYIISKSEVTHTLAERTVLSRVNCPFIVPLKFSFQSPEKLYLVLAFINGGELFYHLQKEGRFDLSRSRFYTAELLCALETLHNLNVIYRDLKPENILLDYQGHITLCDFGLCKLNMKDDDKTDTFCGTPEYLAPELLLGQGYSKEVDWWTLGVLLYEMLTGLPPYYDEDVPKMYKKILKEPLRFPEGFDSDAKDLLIGLLSRDPKRRLGYNGADEIKNHPFFYNLSWKRLWMKGYISPYKPPVTNSSDTSNFDQEFTREKPIDSVVDEFLSNSVQQQFGGWTYVGNEQLGSPAT